MVALVHLVLSPLTEGVHAVTAVESAADLFVRLHKALKLNVQVFVLVLQNAAVVLQGVYFLSDVVVPALEALVREAQIVLLSARHVQVLFALARLGFVPVEVASKVTVAGEFVFALLDKVVFLAHFQIEGAREIGLFVLQTFELIFGGVEVVLSVFVGLAGAAQVELTHVCDLCELGTSLLQFEEVVVS